MAISPNTLIHFTREKDSLKSILQKHFQVTHCKESVAFGEKKINFFVPMVSFCDIPLSEVKKHISSYGEYGIGLTKEWGVRMGLNPVLYLESKSSLSKSLWLAVNHFLSGEIRTADDWGVEQKSLAEVLRYTKNYEGDLIRKSGDTTIGYRFSDEREWRYTPPASDITMLRSTSEFDDPEIRNADKAKLDKLPLAFAPDDIKYIIIKNDSEITEFVNHLRLHMGSAYTLEIVERLTSRIFTTKQIFEDV